MKAKPIDRPERDIPGRCWHCNKPTGEPNRFICFSGSAEHYSLVPESKRRIHVSLWIHGDHSTPEREAVAADRMFPLVSVPDDQFSVVFCSYRCLRTWFNRYVRLMEREEVSAKRRGLSRIRRETAKQKAAKKKTDTAPKRVKKAPTQVEPLR